MSVSHMPAIRRFTRCSGRGVAALLLAGVVLLLVGCDTALPSAPTATPTWAFTAPTLRPTSPVLQARPTERSREDLVAGQNNPTAAALPADSELPPVVLDEQEQTGEQSVRITLADGEQVFGRLYKSPSVQIEGREIDPRLPGLLLIGGTPSAWGDFPQRLRESGYTVLAVDMGPNEDVADLRDVLLSMSELGTVNPGIIGVIGAGRGATQALDGCAAEMRCDALVLLSPLGGGPLADSMEGYNPRPVMIAASRGDASAYQTAQAIAQVASGEINLELLDGSQRSAELVADNPTLAEQVITWLQTWLKD